MSTMRQNKSTHFNGMRTKVMQKTHKKLISASKTDRGTLITPRENSVIDSLTVGEGKEMPSSKIISSESNFAVLQHRYSLPKPKMKIKSKPKTNIYQSNFEF